MIDSTDKCIILNVNVTYGYIELKLLIDDRFYRQMYYV